MPAQLNITLPDHMVELVKRKVSSGEFASESDVICEGLDLLEDRDEGVERWLREDVVPACLEFQADPSTAPSSSEVLAELEQARRARQKQSA